MASETETARHAQRRKMRRYSSCSKRILHVALLSYKAVCGQASLRLPNDEIPATPLLRTSWVVRWCGGTFPRRLGLSAGSPSKGSNPHRSIIISQKHLLRSPTMSQRSRRPRKACLMSLHWLSTASTSHQGQMLSTRSTQMHILWMRDTSGGISSMWMMSKASDDGG